MRTGGKWGVNVLAELHRWFVINQDEELVVPDDVMAKFDCSISTANSAVAALVKMGVVDCSRVVRLAKAPKAKFRNPADA